MFFIFAILWCEKILLVVFWQSSSGLSSLLVITRRPQEDNTEDYKQMKEEYLELHEDTKPQPKKNRKKLPKLKMNKNTKKLIRMVNRIIKTTSTDDMNITNINLIQYAGALLITNKDNTCQTNNHFICR